MPARMKQAWAASDRARACRESETSSTKARPARIAPDLPSMLAYSITAQYCFRHGGEPVPTARVGRPCCSSFRARRGEAFAAVRLSLVGGQRGHWALPRRLGRRPSDSLPASPFSPGLPRQALEERAPHRGISGGEATPLLRAICRGCSARASGPGRQSPLHVRDGSAAAGSVMSLRGAHCSTGGFTSLPQGKDRGEVGHAASPPSRSSLLPRAANAFPNKPRGRDARLEDSRLAGRSAFRSAEAADGNGPVRFAGSATDGSVLGCVALRFILATRKAELVFPEPHATPPIAADIRRPKGRLRRRTPQARSQGGRMTPAVPPGRVPRFYAQRRSVPSCTNMAWRGPTRRESWTHASGLRIASARSVPPGLQFQQVHFQQRLDPLRRVDGERDRPGASRAIRKGLHPIRLLSAATS